MITWFLFINVSTTRGITQPIQQEMGQVESSSIQLANSAGTIELSSGASADTLIEGSAQTYNDRAPSAPYEITDKVGKYSLTTGDFNIVPLIPGFNQPEWNLKVTDDIPLNLEITTGAGKQNLDLTGMDIDNLEASVALGELTVTLPEDDTFEGTLSNPVGSLTINIPRGTLAEFSLDTAITGKRYPSEFTGGDNILYSPGADSSNARIRLQIEQPIGSLTIQWVP